MKIKRYLIMLFVSLFTFSVAWAQEDVPRFSYKVLQTYPHNIDSFTQ
ncbi:MAG: glutamine cyclotransferase, partial [Pseudohongiellaceae bacterium]